MTEQEWLDNDDSNPAVSRMQTMLDFLENRASSRKMHLFAVACCKRVLHLYESEQCRNGVEIAERYAEALADEAARVAADKGFWRSFPDEGRESLPPVTGCVVVAVHVCLYATGYDAAFSSGWASSAVGWTALGDIQEPCFEARDRWNETSQAARAMEQQIQFAMLRDIIGNPFRPVAIDPRWQSSTVLDLARTIYDERRPENMPILADALMDAGCDSEEILAHCRDAGPHVRGCWVVDLLLGKA